MQLKPCRSDCTHTLTLFGNSFLFSKMTRHSDMVWHGMVVVFLDFLTPFNEHFIYWSLHILASHHSSRCFCAPPSTTLARAMSGKCFHKRKIPPSIFIRTIIIYILVTSFALYAFNICRTCRFVNKNEFDTQTGRMGGDGFWHIVLCASVRNRLQQNWVWCLCFEASKREKSA